MSATNELFLLIQKSCFCKPDEVESICNKVQDCIHRGAYLNRNDRAFIVPLWDAIGRMAPIEVIRLLYINNKAAKHIQGLVDAYSSYETRNIIYLYTIESHMSLKFGDYFRNMHDSDIKYIDYALKILEILEMKECDIDWDLCMKLGYND
jgi:hypothetical protein